MTSRRDLVVATIVDVLSEEKLSLLRVTAALRVAFEMGQESAQAEIAETRPVPSGEIS